MERWVKLQFGGFLVVLGIISAVHGAGDVNATEVSSCFETKDGTDYVAQLANDGDVATCAKTCFQTGAWIRVPNKVSGLVNKVEIRGFMPKYTQILIGDQKSDLGFRANFSGNAPCIVQTDADTDPNKAVIDHTFVCSVPRPGSIISFKNGDTDTTPQLILCEVTTSYDASLL